jgi:hypothetical protein
MACALDFRLEDAWALPVQGGVGDFAALIEVMASLDPASGESTATRLLFRTRHRLGGWFGWDDDAGQLPSPGRSETTRSVRLPEDLRNTATDVDLSSTSFITTARGPESS